MLLELIQVKLRNLGDLFPELLVFAIGLIQFLLVEDGLDVHYLVHDPQVLLVNALCLLHLVRHVQAPQVDDRQLLMRVRQTSSVLGVSLSRSNCDCSLGMRW